MRAFFYRFIGIPLDNAGCWLVRNYPVPMVRSTDWRTRVYWALRGVQQRIHGGY
jgi:hypothetical protein